MRKFPKRIICLTEESVETLFALGRGDLIVGTSIFVKRPPEALAIAKVSQFNRSNLQKIKELNPDLILGFSDIQKDIAQELIGEGFNVFIANHRSIEGILNYVLMLGSLVGERSKAQDLVKKLEDKLKWAQEQGQKLKRKPKVYFEEWDDPMICGIQWVSELIETCGAEDVAKEKAKGAMARDRFVDEEFIRTKNPDYIFPCWCGKKVNVESIKKRNKWDEITAVRENRVVELVPEVFLQPGPAVILDGTEILLKHFFNETAR